MEQSSRWVISGLALATGLWVSATALAQGGRVDADEREAAAQATSIDAQTGKTLNEAIELLNADNYAGAAQKISTLQLERPDKHRPMADSYLQAIRAQSPIRRYQ